MWITRTQKEIEIEFAKRKNTARKFAIILWILLIPLAAFLKPKSTIGIGGKYFVSIEEAIDRLWWIVPLFGIGGYLQYRFDLKKKTLFCLSCEKTFEDNKKEYCNCGKKLDYLEYYKWK